MSPALLTELPSELISLIFDHLDIRPLVHMSHVCTLYRSIARAHPTFWRDVTLSGVESFDLELFMARIYSKTTHGLRLDIAVFHVRASEGDAYANPVWTVVLPAIRQHLFRIAYLRLSIRPVFAPVLFDMLRQPAACLETLVLDLDNPGDLPVALPSDILGEQCHKLRRVDIGDCDITQQSIPAFAHVENFRIGISYRESLPPNLFSLLPALKHLSIHSDIGTGDHELFIAVFRQAPRLLSLALDLNHGGAVCTLFQQVPRLLSIPTIEFPRSHPAANILSTRLPGPLGIEIAAKSPVVARYTILSHSRGWRRTFSVHSDKDFGWPLPKFYAAEAIGGRVTTLALDASLAHVSHLIGKLVACETLQLALDCALDVEPSHRLLLPALKRIVVSSKSPLYVTVAAPVLDHFLGALVCRTSSQIVLQMDGALLSGDSGWLSHYRLVAAGQRGQLETI